MWQIEFQKINLIIIKLDVLRNFYLQHIYNIKFPVLIYLPFFKWLELIFELTFKLWLGILSDNTFSFMKIIITFISKLNKSSYVQLNDIKNLLKLNFTIIFLKFKF